MTVTVKYEGYPDRLACEVCRCEVAAMGRPGYVAYGWEDHSEAGISWYLRPLELDEPAIYRPRDCACRCHESARAFLHNRYDDE